jgi:hypothetical protein
MNPGSETFQVQLSREGPGHPWGFRLQGGKDFTTPLSVQSVNPGGIAERAGIRAGDAVLQINSRSSDELEHEQAKQEIIASGNNVSLVVQRGAVTIWKPKVTPMSELVPQEVKLIPSSATAGDTYVQKTSLAANKQEMLNIGSAYNRTARPFGSATTAASVPAGTSAPANIQYNTPVGLYSSDNLASTYRMQSAALQSDMNSTSQRQPTGYGSEPMPPAVGGIRSVKAPVFDPNQHQVQQAQHMTCKACGSLIIGVFVRVKGEPLHPECFRCVKCGKNLKNQGYFMIEGQMYCETDAKLVSQSGAGQDMYAVPVYR